MKNSKPFDPSILPPVPMRTETREFVSGGQSFSKTFTLPQTGGRMELIALGDRLHRLIETYISGPDKKPVLDGVYRLPVGVTLCQEIASLMEAEEATGALNTWTFEQWTFLAWRDEPTYTAIYGWYLEMFAASYPHIVNETEDKNLPLPNGLTADAGN